MKKYDRDNSDDSKNNWVIRARQPDSVYRIGNRWFGIIDGMHYPLSDYDSALFCQQNLEGLENTSRPAGFKIPSNEKLPRIRG